MIPSLIIAAHRSVGQRLTARFAKRSDGGFVLVWAAIVLMLMMTFAGFAIDLGNWHLQAAKMHRATDAAAMAGVVKMPDLVAAESAALETMKRNGIVDNNTTVNISATAVSSDRLSVEVTDTHVETIFASWLVDHISLTRKSTAKYRDPIKLGNATNQMGTGDWFEGTFKDEPYQGFYLAINGYCTATEFGDPYASRYSANQGPLDGSRPTKCDGSAGYLNPLYRPTTTKDGGYNYIIEVPNTGQDQYLYFYDAPFAYNGWSSTTGRSSTDGEVRFKGDTLRSKIDTNFRLFTTSQATKADPSDDVPYATRMFLSVPPNTGNAACVATWCAFMSTPLPPGTYRLNVTTPYDGTSLASGSNSYGVRVAPSPTGSVGFNLPGVDPVTCDTRDNALCPQVYALNDFSIQTRPGAVPGPANLYLADIEPNYAGSKMKIHLFDAGDTAKSLQLLRPDQKCMPFTWSTPVVLNAAAMSGTASSEDCSSESSKVDVSGTSTQITGRNYKAKFNDRFLTLNTSVPVNYHDVVTAAQGDTWWKIRYNPDGTNTPYNDRTTWVLEVVHGGPVHLVRNP